MKFWEILKGWVVNKKPAPTPTPIPMTDEKNILVLPELIRYKVDGKKMEAHRPSSAEHEQNNADSVVATDAKRKALRARDDAVRRVLESRKESERDRLNMLANRK